jgi:hypothetical protein
MATASGPLLRSAPMREFNALGSVGRPVFDSAPQVRATIRRQLGADIAAMLAIPQIGESGRDVDWYAPEGGLVVPWSAASPEERDAMRGQLQAAREKVAAHAASLGVQLSGRPAQNGADDFEVYARLLPHVMRIPNESHIYSVDGKPVLTFWGFSDPRLPDADPIRDLMPAVPAAQAAAMMPPPAAPVLAPTRPWWSRWWLWLLLLLLVLLLGLFGLRSCAPEILPPAFRSEIVGEQKVPEIPPTREVPPVGTVVVPGVLVPGVVVPGNGTAADGAVGVVPNGAIVPDAATPPGASPQDQPATPPQPDASQSPQVPPQPDASKDNAAPQDKTVPPQPNDAAKPQAKPETPLTIPPQAKAGGGTDFLNGKWTSRGGLMDSRTGLPASVEYDFQGGKGKVTITRGDGTTCVGNSSATMQGGKLVITGQDDPRCGDGSSFGRSTVECTQGASGAAKCSGKPQQGPEYSVDMTR